MFKIIVLCLLGFALTAAWQIFIKIKVTEKYRARYFSRTLPENAQTELTETKLIESKVIEIEYYDQVLFDDAVKQFFEQKIHIRDIQAAEEIQHNLLKKLPAKALTQIRKLDLNEWSIYWNFYDQSLEYYVGKYGVFCSHVDRNGAEHKSEFKTHPEATDLVF